MFHGVTPGCMGLHGVAVVYGCESRNLPNLWHPLKKRITTTLVGGSYLVKNSKCSIEHDVYVAALE